MENNDPQQPPPPSLPPPTTTTPPPAAPPPPAFPYTHLLQQQQQHQLQSFWSLQRHEIEHVNDFKNHQLPLARIKKIMKADEDVRMISAEAPILFAKACELFILELTIRSWLHAEENKRRTLQKNDIAAAITRTDIFDFLVDIVPREEPRDEGANAAGAGGIVGGIVGPGAVANGVPYYYQSDPAAGVVIGRPGLDPMAGIYPPVSAAAWQSVWQSGPPPPPPDEGNSSQGNLD